ncbi:MAG: aspartate kinase [Myxococcaceae bacterium]
MGTLVVQKYGGSSVSSVEKIKAVAAKVKARRAAGNQLVVVVSAMGDTTDELLGLAKGVSADPPRRELDMLLTCGERISMALLSMALQELGEPAISFTGSQSGIITDGSHAQARIVEVKPSRIEEELARGKVVIVAGYQGVSRDREVTTLGRGGSDTTAVALAAALGADCEIYSDVDGVFSADPRVVPDAKKLESLSYDEMQELAVAGAKVLNAIAVELAKKAGIVIHAKSTHTAGSGTRIEKAAGLSGRVRGVTCEQDLWVLGVHGNVGALLEMLDAREVKGRTLDDDALDGHRARLVVPLADVHGPVALKAELVRLGVEVRDDLATVTCVGTGINADWSHPRKALAIAEELQAPVAGLHLSSLAMTLLVPREKAAELTRRLHAALV